MNTNNVDDYDSLQETLDLLSIPGFRNKIKASFEDIEIGNTIPSEELFKSI